MRHKGRLMFGEKTPMKCHLMPSQNKTRENIFLRNMTSEVIKENKVTHHQNITRGRHLLSWWDLLPTTWIKITGVKGTSCLKLLLDCRIRRGKQLMSQSQCRQFHLSSVRHLLSLSVSLSPGRSISPPWISFSFLSFYFSFPFCLFPYLPREKNTIHSSYIRS